LARWWHASGATSTSSSARCVCSDQPGRGSSRRRRGGRLRYIPLTIRLAAALRDHRHLRGPLVLYQDDGSPLTEGLVQGFVKRAAQKAGVFNNGPHMLRHTFCSHLAMRGAPARAIQELAGHQNLTTTQRYMHLSPAALDSAIRLLDQPDREKFRGDILETEDREIEKSNAWNTLIGGERGIRTLGRVSSTHAFQACSFNHSDISPSLESTICERSVSDYRTRHRSFLARRDHVCIERVEAN
jgi:hypothetical protein